VSRMTVSNAFSRPDQLSAELRERILEVAGRLGYGGPDPLARGLRAGRIGAIGVLVTETLGFSLKDPYTTDVLAGIAEAAGAADTGLLLVPLPPGHAPGPLVQGAAVDGFIVFNLPDGHPAMDAANARGLPLVTIDGPHLSKVPFVSIDERRASRELTEHVLAAGHRRLVLLTFRVVDDGRVGEVDAYRLDHATYNVTRERLHGILEATTAAGDDIEVEIREVAEQRLDIAQRDVLEALERHTPPTAIMALSDRLALGILDTLHENGLAVPDDVSLTGFDDLDPAAAAGLTTVRQPGITKGRIAAQLLTGQVPAPTAPLPHELIVRSSVGPPPTISD
jgi:DNA-binding LacI/PurR family transcriptional regulator